MRTERQFDCGPEQAEAWKKLCLDARVRMRTGTVEAEEWHWLHTWCLEHKPRRVMEIGVLWYTSSLAFLKAMNKVPDMWLLSIDPGHRNHNKGIFHGKNNPKNLFRRGVMRRWWRVIAYSQTFMPVLAPGYDLIFIDGDHMYDAVHADFTNALNLINPGGTIVTHDCEGVHVGDNTWTHVKDALIDIRGEDAFEWYPGRFPGEKKGFAVYVADD